MLRLPHLPWLTVILTAALGTSLCASRLAHAQTCLPGVPVCVGPDGKIVAAPPPVTVTTPPVTVQADPQAQARAEAEARARAALEAEIRRVEAWQNYLAWRLQVRVGVEAEVEARVHAEAEAYARGQPDPFAGRSVVGASGGGGPAGLSIVPISYPRVEVGPVSVCAATFWGPRAPLHAGFCPPVRVRFDDTWGLSLDPSFLFQEHGGVRFHTVGFHPALLYRLVQWPRPEDAGSYVFARAGLDGWLPVDHLAQVPDLFLGAHTGLGLHSQAELTTQDWGRVLGWGVELRALTRFGTSAADAGMARLRFGAEVRIYALSIAW